MKLTGKAKQDFENMKEDWEREHLKDQMYIKEAKWLEMEHYYEEERLKQQKPAKIKLLLEKNPIHEKNKKILEK